MRSNQPEEPSSGGNTTGPVEYIKRKTSNNAGLIVAVVVIVFVIAVYVAQH